MRCVLDLHDFSVVNNRMDLLLTMKKFIPQFKVSLFTIPIDEKKDFGPYQIRADYLKLIKENLDWIEIIPHGYMHNGKEMKYMDYDTMVKTLVKIEEAFNKDGLPFVRGFCAPHWKMSAGVVKALDEAGWWGAIDPRQPDMLSTKRFYRYTHSIDAIDQSQELLKLHGHIYGTRNDYGKCFNSMLSSNIMNAEWHFASEFIKTKN